MRTMPWGAMFLVVALVAGSKPLRAADAEAASPDKDTGGGDYQLVIDLSNAPGPFPHEQYKFLDQSALMRLCADENGCKMEMKIAGPSGNKGSASTVHLSTQSLAYTTTLALDPPPYADADRHNIYLGILQAVTGAGDALCGITDQDDNQWHRDETVGFAMDFVVVAAGVGYTTCGLVVHD